MTDGEKLFITIRDHFDYNKSHWDHIHQFDILTQFFEHRNNLYGFVDDIDGARIIPGSDVDILVNDLHEGFEAKDVQKVVEKYLYEYEMYEVLADYTALKKEQLILS